MKKYLPYLIVLNILWSFAAIIYDFDKIAAMPIYVAPFLAVCPVYPALLALHWYILFKFGKPNVYTAAFAGLPSIMYFILALIYYPLWMLKHGFNWLAFGQIFWVAFYGLQGFYILIKQKSTFLALVLAIIFVLMSLIFQIIFNSYSFFELI